MRIGTVTQSELDILLADSNVTSVASLDLNALPLGTIIRIKPHHHWKYLLEIDELGGRRAVHVVLSDKTGNVGSAKYRGLYVVRPEYMTIEIGKQFKYGNILTAVLAEISILS
ncbi:MAG: hypothetical protein G01um101448_1162 [Parcubacteria group bacterium Gr01-1014_48]|nr:MAG: hypothetical protein Greene041614_1144 [Parcubacteria group bacterium Greene0416_14]TSC71475.1 MAG: hypothetical protein G01um101448_1162 [Parcubacteria group bacterium Gr01-1014_48]TSC99939.1 MAG: hypothetical protein Greene101415_1034 [Parcubacteria group bacterium Greene1014_15]